MRATRTLPLALTMTFALTACGGSALSGGGGDEGGDDDKVKIALLVPQSGVYAPLGKDMEPASASISTRTTTSSAARRSS